MFSDDTAIVEMAFTFTALNGRPYSQRHCWITRFVDGLNEELFYTQMVTKPKLKVSRFLKTSQEFWQYVTASLAKLACGETSPPTATR